MSRSPPATAPPGVCPAGCTRGIGADAGIARCTVDVAAARGRNVGMRSALLACPLLLAGCFGSARDDAPPPVQTGHGTAATATVATVATPAPTPTSGARRIERHQAGNGAIDVVFALDAAALPGDTPAWLVDITDNWLPEPPPAPTLDAVADALVAEWRRGGGRWAYRLNVTTTPGPGLVNVIADLESDLGSGPADRRRLYAWFDAASGRRLAFYDVVRPEGRAKLDALARDALRHQAGIAPGRPLADGGFTAPDDLPCTENILVTAQGLTASWNPFLIAPAHRGRIDVALPATELTGVLHTR
jgi:hypothetical protein